MMMTAQEKMYLAFLFLAYTGLFLIMFGFMFKMLRKSRQLTHDVKMLTDEWSAREHGLSVTESSPPVVPNVRGREL